MDSGTSLGAEETEPFGPSIGVCLECISINWANMAFCGKADGLHLVTSIYESVKCVATLRLALSDASEELWLSSEVYV